MSAFIIELDDAALGLGPTPAAGEGGAEPAWKLRRAARAVLSDGGALALLHVAREGYWKLPGGGIEGRETPREALERESVEETGTRIAIGREIGVCLERRESHALLQLSICHEARVVERIGPPTFTAEELAGGFELAWLDPAEALARLEAARPTNYVGRFIARRDAAILRAWLGDSGCLRDLDPAPGGPRLPSAVASIRDCVAADGPAVAVLAGELGYATAPADASVRIAALATRPEERFRVAVGHDGAVLGWCSLEAVRRVYHEPFLEVTGLVVTARARGKGVGRALMEDAEALGRELGVGMVRLKSNALRVEAHRFYEGMGYERTKTQFAFQKRLGAGRAGE